MFQQIRASQQQIHAIVQFIETIIVLDVLRCNGADLLSASPGLPLTGQLGRRQSSGGGKEKKLRHWQRINQVYFYSSLAILQVFVTGEVKIGEVRSAKQARRGYALFVTGEVKIGEVRSAKQARRGYASARTLQTNYYGRVLCTRVYLQRFVSTAAVGSVSWPAEPKELGTRWRWGTSGQPLDGGGMESESNPGEREVESTPRPERNSS